MSSSKVGDVVGSLHEVDGEGVVRVRSRYATTPEDLWDALTVPDRLARWLGHVEGDLRLGGTFEATFTSSWSGPGVIEVCDPPRRLVARMGTPAEETITEAVLEPDEDGVLLVVEERGLPLDHLPAYGAGWQAHLEDLGRHLAGVEPGDWRERWSELVPGYRER